MEQVRARGSRVKGWFCALVGVALSCFAGAE